MASARDAKTSSRDGWEDADEEEPRGDAIIGEIEMRHTHFGQGEMMRSQTTRPRRRPERKHVTLTVTLTLVGTKVIMTKFASGRIRYQCALFLRPDPPT